MGSEGQKTANIFFKIVYHSIVVRSLKSSTDVLACLITLIDSLGYSEKKIYIFGFNFGSIIGPTGCLIAKYIKEIGSEG